MPLVQPSEKDITELLVEAQELANQIREASTNCGFQHPALEQARIAAEGEVQRLNILKEGRELGQVVKASVGAEQELGVEPRSHWKYYALIDVVPGRSSSYTK